MYIYIYICMSVMYDRTSWDSLQVGFKLAEVLHTHIYIYVYVCTSIYVYIFVYVDMYICMWYTTARQGTAGRLALSAC